MNVNIEVNHMNKHFFPKLSQKIEKQSQKEQKTRTKICLYDFFSINEIQISDIIEEAVPYYENHFDIVYDYDFIKIGQLNENIIENINVDIQKKYMLMEFKKRKCVKFNDFLFQFKDPKRIILNTLHSFSYLLDSLIKLYQNNICFFDLSVENIIFDLDCGEKPILVQFQKSLQLGKINEGYITQIIADTEMSYTCKPLEVHVLFYLIHNHLETISRTFIEEITEMYVKNVCVLNLFSLSYKESFKFSCIKSLERYINKPKSFIIQDIIERTCETWDSYSLSIIYLHIFGNMSRFFSLKETFIGKLSILLSKNIHPEPEKREKLIAIMVNYENLFSKFTDWSFVKKIPISKMDELLKILFD